MVNVLNAVLGTMVFLIVCVVLICIVFWMFKYAAIEPREDVEEGSIEN
ncbi:MAG: hypothetical protein KAU62_16765 [Candidatus Heimdallarchaeota archaeon]|nr:hypothetical protein [Candidatus Heimdallarchaeota archaeon]MCG3257760.1 hypothetical protein [Candidatus Heimdallarchaeota archaeon]MCK4612810.1 hypothetical protein [Candidatus Heimdallarchaeota archaeon]